MTSIYLLIPIAMLFVSIAVLLFFWAVKSNQYDDLDREGMNILFDEAQPSEKSAHPIEKLTVKKTGAVIDHAQQ